MKFGIMGNLYNMYWVPLTFSFQGHFGIICTCLKMACNPKTANRRAKQIEICHSRIIMQHIWGAFDLLVFTVIHGSFDALVSKWPVARKGP